MTSASEIQAMRGYLSRAAGIKHLDQQMKQTIRDTKAYLRRMETNTFHILLGARSAAFELMAPGLGCTLLMGTVLAAFALAPLLLLLWGFGLLTSGSIGDGFLILLISMGLSYLMSSWLPRKALSDEPEHVQEHRTSRQSITRPWTWVP